MCTDLLANTSALQGPYPVAQPHGVCPVEHARPSVSPAFQAQPVPVGDEAGIHTHAALAAGEASGRGRSSIPGPRTPLIGWQARLIPILRDPVVGMLELQRRYGDIVAFGQNPSAPV